MPTEIEIKVADVLSTALLARLPEIKNLRFAGKVEWEGHDGEVKFHISGTLPSGRSYDIPVDFDPVQIAYSPSGWLNSAEFKEALDRVVAAFKVAIALEGQDVEPRRFGSRKGFGVRGYSVWFATRAQAEEFQKTTV